MSEEQSAVDKSQIEFNRGVFVDLDSAAHDSEWRQKSKNAGILMTLLNQLNQGTILLQDVIQCFAEKEDFCALEPNRRHSLLSRGSQIICQIPNGSIVKILRLIIVANPSRYLGIFSLIGQRYQKQASGQNSEDSSMTCEFIAAVPLVLLDLRHCINDETLRHQFINDWLVAIISHPVPRFLCHCYDLELYHDSVTGTIANDVKNYFRNQKDGKDSAIQILLRVRDKCGNQPPATTIGQLILNEICYYLFGECDLPQKVRALLSQT